MDFLEKEVVLAIHDGQLAKYGGLGGVRDNGLLDSALARPQNAEAYGVTDLHALAASLAFGISRNHPFLDGNKRTGLGAALIFLALNDVAIPDPSPEMVDTMVKLAEGAITEEAFADWLRAQPTR